MKLALIRAAEAVASGLGFHELAGRLYAYGVSR